MGDQLLHTNDFDAELWRIDGQLWCGRRQRTRGVIATVLWWGLAAASWAVTIMVGLSLALGHGSNPGLMGALIGTAVLGFCGAVMGRRAYRRDRTERRLSIRELPHVLRINPTDRLLWPSGGPPRPSAVPLTEVRVVLAATDMDDYTRYGLSLAWPGHEVEVFWAPQRAWLDPVLGTLAEAGLNCTDATLSR